MKRIKIGIFGAGARGMSLAQNFLMLNCEVVAVCEFRKERVPEIIKKLGEDISIYDNFDEFLNHDMDAVVLANYFHEHAPYAVKCFEKGLHVFSECISNGTMAEGVELIRAWEKSNSVYMLAENYPQMIFNREIKRICDTKTLGKILYAEGEYNHPSSPMDIAFKKEYVYFPKHWRNYVPRTYYCTHSLGPIMCATGATPKKVTAFAVYDPITDEAPIASYVADRTAVIMTQNDDGSIYRIVGCATYGGHHNSYRVCGTKGQIENLRGMGDKIMLRYNSWDTPEGAEKNTLYEPSWNDPEEELIKASGHGGADYLTARTFVNCIREGRQPEHPFHIHAAVAMSSVAILAHRSMMNGGMPYDIPDFRLEECRKQYENDTLSPFYKTDGSEPTIPCCSNAEYKPTEEQMKKFEEIIM